MQHWLETRGVDERPLRFPIAAATVGIGRDAAADIRVPLPDVHGRHCRIEVDAGGLRLVALPNAKVLVNGDEVAGERTIAPGDVLKVSLIEFAVHEAGVPVVDTSNAGRTTRLPSID